MPTNSRRRKDRTPRSRPMNNGFWDRPADERAARMGAACERNGVADFWDLPPEERARAYGNEDEGVW